MSRENRLSVSFEGGDRGAIGDESSQMRGALLHSEKIQDPNRCTSTKYPCLVGPRNQIPWFHLVFGDSSSCSEEGNVSRLALVAVHSAYRAHQLGALPSLPHTPSFNPMKAFKKSNFAKKVKGFLICGSDGATGDTGRIDPPSRPHSSLAIRPSEAIPPTSERRKSDGENRSGQFTLRS